MKNSTKNILLIIGVGVGAYLIYKVVKGGISGIGAAIQADFSSLGSGVTNFFNSLFGSGLDTTGATGADGVPGLTQAAAGSSTAQLYNGQESLDDLDPFSDTFYTTPIYSGI